jgi:formylglycine-generating enzyme required for sulfatase activity
MEGSRAGEVREYGGIEMVWCPPGEFLMGSPEDEADRNDDEMQHRVRLTRGFWMAKTETTQGQWERVMRENPSDFSGEDLPVETVSRYDVQGWLEKMNEKTPLPSGWKWDLPTEAQWEYACRAGTGRAFAGDSDEMAWYDENSGRTNPVGTKKANAWGLHDMHGNVWEWCSGWYGDYSSASSSDPTGATAGGKRVARGGSWVSFAQYCRSAYRGRCASVTRSDDLGFRPALVPSIR